MTIDRRFDKLLEESARIHGHLCPGQVRGVRMALCGLASIGICDPRGKDRKKLCLFVEIDRCATDALQSVTGCSLGHRTMKFLDYGKMAATFVNLETGRAVRIVAREESKDKAKEYFPEIEDKYHCQLEAYKIMEDLELFTVQDVRVRIPPQDMPGRPLGRVQCDKCGEHVQDMREVRRQGQVLCRPCAEGGYCRSAAGLTRSVMQKSHNEVHRAHDWDDRQPLVPNALQRLRRPSPGSSRVKGP